MCIIIFLARLTNTRCIRTITITIVPTTRYKTELMIFLARSRHNCYKHSGRNNYNKALKFLETRHVRPVLQHYFSSTSTSQRTNIVFLSQASKMPQGIFVASFFPSLENQASRLLHAPMLGELNVCENRQEGPAEGMNAFNI